MGSRGAKEITLKNNRAPWVAIGLYYILASSVFFSVNSETFYLSSISMDTSFDFYKTSMPSSSFKILSALFNTLSI